MIIHYGERFSFPDFIMSVIEILENLNEDYELEIDGEKVSFDVIIKYIKRLEKLEEITSSFPCVEKAFAIQAGREVRIMVVPEQVSDAEYFEDAEATDMAGNREILFVPINIQ